MTTESAPRWRRLEPDERKEQIFACAAELFGDKPYAEVSTSDIAAAAGVARGLINHYFGTKRELYLTVVRKALTLPRYNPPTVSEGTLAERTAAAVDWYLDLVAKQEKMWLAAIAPEGIGRDPDVERIHHDADRDSADSVLDAIGITATDPHRDELNALVRAYGGMVKSAGREWLVRKSLGREQVHALLNSALVAMITNVFPIVQRKVTAEHRAIEPDS